MPKKHNQTYNLELPDNKLGKHLGTTCYPALWGTNWRKKAAATSSNNYRIMKRPHS